ncbi:MAG: lipopolysaccharide biosynthesis protein [Blastocatellia bacterium]|nr:lipopolysaccharide biosynthesis protein [Blastocatellia bacterium]
MKTAQTEEMEQSGGRLTQRAALIMAANVIATALTFAVPLVLVRSLSQSEFGIYKQAFQIVLSALALLNLQVAVSVFYFTARAPGKKLQVAHNVMLFYTLLGAVVFLTFLLWPSWVTLIFRSSDLVPHVPLIGLVIFSSLVSNNLDAIPIANGDVRIASVLIVAGQLTKAVCMVTAAFVFGTINAILLASVLQGAVQTSYMALYIRRRFGRFLAEFDWPLFKAQIGNALPFGFGGIASILQSDLHNYFVSYHFEPAVFAVYAVGCFQVPILGMLSSSFASAVNPELARCQEAGDKRAIIWLWMDVVRKLSFFYIPAFAVLFTMRSELITLLFTAKYSASIPIFSVYLLGVLYAVPIHMHILRLFDELRYFRLKLYLVLLPITWGALILGLRVYGLVGVAIAVVSVQALDLSINLFVIGRKLEIRRRDLSQLNSVLRICGAAAAAAAVTYVVRHALAQLPVFILLCCGAAVFGSVYLIAIFVLGAITREEQYRLRAILWERYTRYIARLKLSW